MPGLPPDLEAIFGKIRQKKHFRQGFMDLIKTKVTIVIKYSRVQKSIENFDFRPKMAIFWRVGMRKGGVPLPLAFQYLIFMI